jgi:hypothetical protein
LLTLLAASSSAGLCQKLLQQISTGAAQEMMQLLLAAKK